MFRQKNDEENDEERVVRGWQRRRESGDGSFCMKLTASKMEAVADVAIVVLLVGGGARSFWTCGDARGGQRGL